MEVTSNNMQDRCKYNMVLLCYRYYNIAAEL
jgi:hypothetical protein